MISSNIMLVTIIFIEPTILVDLMDCFCLLLPCFLLRKIFLIPFMRCSSLWTTYFDLKAVRSRQLFYLFILIILIVLIILATCVDPAFVFVYFLSRIFLYFLILFSEQISTTPKHGTIIVPCPKLVSHFEESCCF